MDKLISQCAIINMRWSCSVGVAIEYYNANKNMVPGNYIIKFPNFTGGEAESQER